MLYVLSPVLFVSHGYASWTCNYTTDFACMFYSGHLFYDIHILAMSQAIPVPANTKDKQVTDGAGLSLVTCPFCISHSDLHLSLNSCTEAETPQ